MDVYRHPGRGRYRSPLRAAAGGEGASGGVSLLTASDSFDRADGPIGTADSGHTWVESGVGSGWTVASNTAKPPSDAGWSWATLDLGAADADISVEMNGNGGGAPDLGIAAKVQDASNLILFDVVFVTDHWICRVFQRVAGSFNGLTALVDPVPGVTNTNAAVFTIRLVTNGAAGEAFIAGTSMGTWSALSDNGILAETAHGLGGTSVTFATFDDFTMTEVA